jgi:hypothetical protein
VVVVVDETRHHRASADIDDPCARTDAAVPEIPDVGKATALYRDLADDGVLFVHRVYAAIGQQDVRNPGAGVLLPKGHARDEYKRHHRAKRKGVL